MGKNEVRYTDRLAYFVIRRECTIWQAIPVWTHLMFRLLKNDRAGATRPWRSVPHAPMQPRRGILSTSAQKEANAPKTAQKKIKKFDPPGALRIDNRTELGYNICCNVMIRRNGRCTQRLTIENTLKRFKEVSLWKK